MLRTPAQWATAVARNRSIALVSDLSNACQITHGRYFWPLEANHPGNDFDMEFIGMVLAGERRWGGILVDEDGFPLDYSVAQHLVHTADIAYAKRRVIMPEVDWDNHPSPIGYAFAHDWSEAYLKDFPRPIKGALGNGDYYIYEAALMDRLVAEFGVIVTPEITKLTKIVDNWMIFLERDKMAGPPVVPYINEDDHPGFTIDDVVPDFHVWDRKTAMTRFLAKWEEITASDVLRAAA
jgi:hypothetical protein